MEVFLLNLVKSLVMSEAQSLVAEQVEELVDKGDLEVLDQIVDEMEDNEFGNIRDFLRG